MIIDKMNTFGTAQAVTSSAATTDHYNAGKKGAAYGNELFFVVQCTEAATAAGAATVNFVLQGSTDAAFTSPVTLLDSGAIGKAALTANKLVYAAKIPPAAKDYQYLRGYFTVGTGPLTAGKFTAFLTPDIPTTL